MAFIDGAFKISNEEYQADPCVEPSLSRGVIMDLLFRSPAHAKQNHPRLNPDCKPNNDSKFSIGQAAHSLFLEGIDNVEVIVAYDWKTKAARLARIEAQMAGKVPLLEKQYGEINEMVKAANKALNESELAGLFDDGDAELSYFWQEGPIWCRARVDKISKDRKKILDFKTSSRSANPNEFIRPLLSMGYLIQESFYRRGVRAVEGTEPEFYFLIQETEPPYLCSFVGLVPQFQEIGNSQVEHGIMKWGKCMKTGVWEGYPSQVCYLSPPAWAITSWEEKRFELEIPFQEEI